MRLSFIFYWGENGMNYDLITLVSKLRHVENLDQLNEVKDLAESFISSVSAERGTIYDRNGKQ